jgi:WD40 repeat protein
VEVEMFSLSWVLRQKESLTDNEETALAFGLDSLPPQLAIALQREDPRLIVFRPFKDFVVIIDQDYGLKAWHVNSLQTVLDWNDAANVVDVGFNPDETLLTAATRDGILHIWVIQQDTYKGLPPLRGHEAALTDTAFSPNDSLLATAGFDGTVRLWDTLNILDANRRQVGQLSQTEPIRTLSFSSNGQQLVTGNDDHTLRVWSLDGQELLCIPHGQPIRLIAFSADRNNLGSVSGSTTLRVWPWPRGLNESSDFPGVQQTCPKSYIQH